MKAYREAKIIENKNIGPGIYLMKVDLTMDAVPGQFIMLRSSDFSGSPILSRPFGIVDIEEDGLSLLYQVKGKGTELMKTYKSGDTVNILGPLGNGFDLVQDRKIAVVAGGIGIAPLLYLVKNLKDKVDFYAGFSDEEYFTYAFKPYVEKIVTTIDKVDKIFITDAINPDDYDIIYACGPNPMLYNLARKTKNAKLYVSMESHMACGIGACLGCTIKNRKGDFVRVCKDGPVFDAKEVF